jgi:saccharopine dehydrogenase (NAD+, L-lysine-forming)
MVQLPEVFSSITLASRRLSSCEKIAKSVQERFQVKVETAEVDADFVEQTCRLINSVQPDLLVNLALPYQDLALMDACLETGVSYMDTANYEPKDMAKFEYRWQWEYQERFEKAGLMALLGSGFDPGVTNVFTAWLRKHHFDRIDTLDILDCNGGDHGHPFATNFNPEINIREVTAAARHWERGAWVESPALSHSSTFDFPQVGERNMYLMYHEELESLVKHFPEIQRARFWMTFGDSYLKHLEVLQNVGLTSIKPVLYKGQEIIPLQFLKSVLPDPGELGERTKGKTCIGNIVTGEKSGKPVCKYLFNVCDHENCYREVGSQAVSYTTGVPAMIGAYLMLQGKWNGRGVFNMEQMDPDPFMDMLNQHGLPWEVRDLDKAPSF